jgi:hypothetical protein
VTEHEPLERLLVEEEEALAEAVALLARRVPLAEWPEPLGAALSLAVSASAGRGGEDWKVVALRRHLFARTPSEALARCLPVATDPSVRLCRVAERLRADLPRLVTIRAGLYLIER